MTHCPTWKVKLDFGMNDLTLRISAMESAAQIATKSIEEISKAEKRKQKSIDRIAWKAEAAQRHMKRGNWK
jgi:uncharacterized protein YtpQ (UPF0354 family)